MNDKYDDTGRAAAWAGEWEVIQKGNKPFTIKCNAHRNLKAGEAFEVAIFENQYATTSRHPTHKGKVQDPWKPTQAGNSRVNQGRDADPVPFDDGLDDIPFA